MITYDIVKSFWRRVFCMILQLGEPGLEIDKRQMGRRDPFLDDCLVDERDHRVPCDWSWMHNVKCSWRFG